MSDFNRIIEEQIRQAIQDGDFDNLPGKGKPLRWVDNPHEDPAWRMAFHALRSSGHSLHWIEKRRQIEAAVEAAQVALSRSLSWRRAALSDGKPNDWVNAEWQRALKSFRKTIAELNKRIFSYNIEVPSAQFQRKPIDVGRKIEAIVNEGCK